MGSCVKTSPIIACFTPANTSLSPVNVIEHIIYNSEGDAVGQAFTRWDTEIVVNPISYLGGGVVEVGACPMPIHVTSKNELCFSNEVNNSVLQGFLVNSSDGSSEYQDGAGALVPAGWQVMGKCPCCDDGSVELTDVLVPLDPMRTDPEGA